MAGSLAMSCRPRLARFYFFEIAADFLPRPLQLIAALEVHPKFCGGAKVLGEAQRGIRTDALLLSRDTLQPRPGDLAGIIRGSDRGNLSTSSVVLPINAYPAAPAAWRCWRQCAGLCRHCDQFRAEVDPGRWASAAACPRGNRNCCCMRQSFDADGLSSRLRGRRQRRKQELRQGTAALKRFSWRYLHRLQQPIFPRG